MTKLTNKAEFIDEMMDSLRIAGFSDPDERLEWAERIWSRLAKRGLAEEPLEPGVYPYVAACHADESRHPVAYWDGRHWHTLVTLSILIKPPAIIGPRIDPPQD